MDWLPDELYFSKRKFVTARGLLPKVETIAITDFRRTYEVDGQSVVLNNVKMAFSCTCKEGTMHAHKGALCEHVLAVIAKEVVKYARKEGKSMPN